MDHVQQAALTVAVKRNGFVLFNVGSNGQRNLASMAEFIKLCTKRQSTKREHNNN